MSKREPLQRMRDKMNFCPEFHPEYGFPCEKAKGHGHGRGLHTFTLLWKESVEQEEKVREILDPN